MVCTPLSSLELSSHKVTNILKTTAEDNPANEYPDEELSSSDEYGDSSAAYRKYRNRANSDDEGYDIDDYDSEGELVARFGQRFHHGLDSENEDDW